MKDQLFDPQLELAVAAEAVTDHGRFATYGVRPSDFATDDARLIVEAALACFAASGRVTLELVAQRLQRDGVLAKMGGVGELAQRLSPGAVSDPAELKRLANYRRLRDVFARGHVACQRKDDAGIMAACEEASQGLSLADTAELRSQWDLIEMLLAEAVDPAKRPPVVHPGLQAFEDAIGGGLSIGELSVCIAPPNTGKSSVTLEIAMASAARNVGCGYISLEDTERTFGARLWGAHAGVNPRQIKHHQLDDAAWDRLARAAEGIRNSRDNFWLVDAIGCDELQVCSIMSRMRARGVRFVIVDYLGVVKCSVKYATPRERTDHVLRALKTHARRLGQHILLVSQISRPQDKSGKPRAPTKYDAKESGNIENECEVMFGLWREEENDWAPVRARILKGKDGGNGAEWMMQRSRRDGRMRVVTLDEAEL